MKQTLYVSRARQPFRLDELEALTVEARVTNRSCGVTGLLVANRLGFAQVIEGRDDAVDAVYDRIAGDPRHDIVMQSSRRIDARHYADWLTAFVQTSKSEDDAQTRFAATFADDAELQRLPGLDALARDLLAQLPAATAA